jgi:hypothetical protein
MQRVVAKIERITIVSRTTDELGIHWRTVSLDLRVVKPAIKGFKLPKGRKGGRLTVERRVPSTRRLRVGDRILLDRDEVSNWLCPLEVSPPIVPCTKNPARVQLTRHRSDAAGASWSASSARERHRGLLDETGSAALDLHPKRYGVGLHRVTFRVEGAETQAVLPVPASNRTLSYALDVDRDGFPEQLLETEFIRCTVAPHLGGRILGLLDRSSNLDIFPILEIYGGGGEYVYPGIDDHIERKGAGSLYNAAFEVKGKGAKGLRMEVKKKDLGIEKRIRLLPGLPLVHERLRIRTSKKSRDIDYWRKLPFRADVSPEEVLLAIPTAEKVESARHRDAGGPWAWAQEHHVGPLGLALAHRGDLGLHLMVFYDPGRISGVKMRCSPFLFTLEIHRNTYELKKGQSLDLGFLQALGRASVVRKDAAFLLSLGPRKGSRRPVCLLGRCLEDVSPEVKFRSGSLSRSIPLSNRRFTGAGSLLVARSILRTEGTEPVEAGLTISGRNIRLRVGGA